MELLEDSEIEEIMSENTAKSLLHSQIEDKSTLKEAAQTSSSGVLQ